MGCQALTKVDIQKLYEYNGEVEELELTEELLAHIASRDYEKHRVSLGEIREVHSGEPKFFPNEASEGAPIVMVGPTAADRVLTVPLEPTGQRGVWRPRTAFEANAHHIIRYHGEADE